MPDWDAIRRDRANGLSLRTLALKYGISKSYIGQILSTASTGHPGQEKPAQTPPILRTSPTLQAAPQSQNLTFTIAQTLVKKIAREVLKPELDPKDMKLIADTLSQCNKIIAQEASDEQEATPYDMRDFLAGCTDEELEIVRPIIAAVQARRENITPLRRTG